MNKKGQALIEFIIIIPFFVMLVIALIDFVKIIDTKIQLESKLDEYILDNDITETSITKEVDANTITYKINENVDITSFFLTPIFGSHYNVTVKRILYE